MKESKKYKAFSIDSDGTRHLIEADTIIIQLEEEEIEISLLPPHPVFQGKLTLTTGSAVRGREQERGAGTHFTIEPGASNVIHITPKKYAKGK
ncbi:hypothetical protein [Chryseobacterium pennipullorum]|uniref:Uncharacterized protein n=1 Tax=Chryseobacterium pennipullorum TaxID=2258963 RepID=A0A3D9AWG5_9FLAO|nr:hypothetical protein [Chryseobacterium pennipullorum]REC45266.1 hypothetical protein DRF67_16385 [Chryseobacterium pennipullorum]